MTQILFAKYKCNKCNYKWIPRVELVKECPNCKNKNWKRAGADLI